MTALALAAAALVAWVGVLLLPWQPHRTRERLALPPRRTNALPARDLGDVTVLIPARDEATVIGETLAALARQGPGLRVLVIDDESTDATAAVCARAGARLSEPAAPATFALAVATLRGQPLPPGWRGKLWALEQGLGHVVTPWTLLLDADIELAAAVIPALLDQARAARAELVSIMARLDTTGPWQKLLAPAFVFFFKLLYPFARVNSRSASTAAAAGGCVLVRTSVLREIGAFATIRGALIDDCALARLVKDHGHALWLGQSHAVVSRRVYADLGSFWRMVSRSAFTQLRYSTGLLLIVVAIMAVVFLGPIAAPLASPRPAVLLISAGALAAMASAYLPVVRFYGLAWAWCLTLPLAAILFLAMTLDSAINYWRGVRARWKNRTYAAADE